MGGQRHKLAGYPNPMVGGFPEVRVTTMVASPDGRYLALTGICEEAEPRVPTCARTFVRLYRAADGAHVRDLPVPWDRDSQDGAEAKAIVFDERGARLAVVVRAPWGACPDTGTNVELVVYDVADGARLERRLIANDEVGEVQRLALSGDRVELRMTDGDGRPSSRVIRLHSKKR